MRYPTLFIDKLAITVPLSAERGAQAQQAIDDSTERWADHINFASIRRSRYRGAFQFEVAPKVKATLLLQPTNPRNNYFKLEYSPDRFGEAGRQLLGEYLQGILGNDYLELLLAGRLTRLDVAFDVRRVRLKDFLIVDLRGGKSSIIRGIGGEAESYYFPFKGTNQLCVYDKLQEDIDKNEPAEPNRIRVPRIRFEYRYKKMSRYTLGDIVGRLENPFRNFVVKEFRDNEGNSDCLRAFFDGCRFEGVDSTLNEITSSELREELHEAYRAFPTPNFWLRRTSIWGGLRQAVEDAQPR